MSSYKRHSSTPKAGLVLVGQRLVKGTLVLWLAGLLAGSEATYPCTSQADTDGATGCDCIEKADELTLSCDRVRLEKIPIPSHEVTHLDLFRLELDSTSLSSEVLPAGSTLTSVRIESCDLTLIESQSFVGLYTLRVLNLAYNRLTVLPPQLFIDSNLLQELDLSYNSLTHLESDTFYGLQNLITLDLSYNRVQSLPTDLLFHLPSLRTLRLQDSLPHINVIPQGMFDYTSLLQTLLVSDNQLTDLQPSLFNKTRELQTLDLRANQLTSVSHHVFDGLTHLRTLQLDENPLICDCKLRGYRDWLREELWRSSWPPESSGSCSEPAHLRRQHVTNLLEEQFQCDPTESTNPITSSTREPLISYGLPWQTQDVVPETTSKEPSQTSAFAVRPSQEQTADERKQKERGIIIGSSIAGAIFLIIANVLIIVCIKRSRKKRATRKIKYILRPEDVNPGKNRPVEEKDTKKMVRVEEAGYGYTISNEFSGIYHTGSVSKLHGDPTKEEEEQHYHTNNGEAARAYDNDLYRENSIPRNLSLHRHYSSQGLAEPDHTTEQPLAADRLNYTYPFLPDQPPERGSQFHQTQSNTDTHHVTDFTDKHVFVGYSMHDGMPHDILSHANAAYIKNSDYLIKDSVGSADSGVDSNSPLPPTHILLIEDTSTPNKRADYSTLPTRYSTLPTRYTGVERQPIIDNTEYSSQSLKKVRSETYV